MASPASLLGAVPQVGGPDSITKAGGLAPGFGAVPQVGGPGSITMAGGGLAPTAGAAVPDTGGTLSVLPRGTPREPRIYTPYTPNAPYSPIVKPPKGRTPIGTPGFPTSPFNFYTPGRVPTRNQNRARGLQGPDVPLPLRGPRKPRYPPKKPKLTDAEREKIGKDPRVQRDNCVRECSSFAPVSSNDFRCKTEACILHNNDWIFRVLGQTYLLKKGQPIDDVVNWANQQCEAGRGRRGQPSSGDLVGDLAPLRPPKTRWLCPEYVCVPKPPPIIAKTEPLYVQLPTAAPLRPSLDPPEGSPPGTWCGAVAAPSRLPVRVCFTPDGGAYYTCGGQNFDPTGRTTEEIVAACGGYAIGYGP